MLPRNAQRILDMRLTGKRPADPVIVSFVDEPPVAGPTVFAKPDIEYDWRFLRDLETIILVRPGLAVGPALTAIFETARLYPTLVDVERRAMASIIGVKPFKTWKFAEHSAGWREVFA